MLKCVGDRPARLGTVRESSWSGVGLSHDDETQHGQRRERLKIEIKLALEEPGILYFVNIPLLHNY
jgi:hypothetical protein